MSAADKLRDLHSLELMHALPDIIAVIAAAEKVSRTGALIIDPEWKVMEDALAALNARLTDTETHDA